MDLPKDEWVVLAEYDPYKDLYELRVYYNSNSNKWALTTGDPITVKKIPEGVELPLYTAVTREAWKDLKLANLFRNVFVRKTHWERVD